MRQLIAAAYDLEQNKYHLSVSIAGLPHQFTVEARYRSRQDHPDRPHVLSFTPHGLYAIFLPSDPALSALHQALFTLKNKGKLELPFDLDHNEYAEAQREALDRNVYVIDGKRFSTLEAFYDEIGMVLIPDTDWGRNLDALQDILRGGFGPLRPGPFTLIWKNAVKSRRDLGYEAMLQWLEGRWLGTDHLTEAEVIQYDYELFKRTYPKLGEEEIQQLLVSATSGLQAHRKALQQASQRQGETIFDWLVEIIKYHPNVRLLLEP